MQFDLRCLQLTVRRHTAFPKMVRLQHYENCQCQPDQMVITHKRAVVINVISNDRRCPGCGLPTHKGFCKDAIREAKGLKAIKWRP